MNYIYHSKKGLFRVTNQDRIIIWSGEYHYLFLLFDGVSSYKQSYRYINQYLTELKKVYRRNSNYDIEEIENILFSAYQNSLQYTYLGKSTILSLCVIKNSDNAFYLSIGDSRLYIFSNQFLDQVTYDDNIEGAKNILTRSLGASDLKREDFIFQPINMGNNFLLCTDGFYERMELQLHEYFNALNDIKLTDVKRKLMFLQRRLNVDDSSFIIVKENV